MSFFGIANTLLIRGQDLLPTLWRLIKPPRKSTRVYRLIEQHKFVPQISSRRFFWSLHRVSQSGCLGSSERELVMDLSTSWTVIERGFVKIVKDADGKSAQGDFLRAIANCSESNSRPRTFWGPPLKSLTATHQTSDKDRRRGAINVRMNLNFRFILTIASLSFALVTWLPTEITAAELKEARVTEVIQDVRLLPSNASPRPAAVNDNVRQGTAVRTGVQSRSELTFKDQTITRLGEKTIFSVGEGARTIDLGSGQFLLYVPKHSGGAKVKMGAVTAAITG